MQNLKAPGFVNGHLCEAICRRKNVWLVEQEETTKFSKKIKYIIKKKKINKLKMVAHSHDDDIYK